MIKCFAVLGVLAVVAPAAADVSLRMRPHVAQAAPDPNDPDAPDAPAPAPAPAPDALEDGNDEVISVSSSTIEHQLFVGHAPVSIVTRAELTATGRATLGDILQALPSQGNAANAQVNAGGDGTTRINLRGLGAARTLVLLNGRRMVNGGAGADSSVDLDAIPLPMIERVEIYKDGASALYGADAVGGVVNIVTRQRFNGIDVSLLTGTSQHGDGAEYDASAVAGFSSDDKHTYLVMSGSFQGHAAVFAGDRDFAKAQKSYDFASRTERRFGSLTTPDGRVDLATVGPGQTAAQPAGCTTRVCRSDRAGGWTDFVAPDDLYNEASRNYLYTPATRYNLMGTAGNRLNDYMGVTAEVLYQHRDSSRELSPAGFVADSPVSKDSLYNPFGADLFDYRRRLTELGPRKYTDDATLLRFVLGVNGSIPEAMPLGGWKYELSYNHGDSTTHAGTGGQVIKPKIADALGPSMLNDRGVPICVRTPGDATSQIIYIVKTADQPQLIPCVPLNPFGGPGTIPVDQLKNLTFDDVGVGNDAMRLVHANAGGRVATLPNQGEIALTLGGDYRQEIGEQAPPSVASVGYTTDTTTLPTVGRFKIAEGYGELSVVPITGHPIAQRVELDLGARALRHSEFGSHLTYKASGLFRTVEGVALRGTYATALRAPSVRDTIGGVVEREPAAEDPCDVAPPSAGDAGKVLDPDVQARCTAQGVPVGTRFNTSLQRAAIGGNPALRAETAKTATVGAVYEPPQLHGIAVTADYWWISIDHAIEALGAQTILANCYERGLDDFCAQIHRDPVSHRIAPIVQVLQNVRRTTTSGIDVAVRYDGRIASYGQLQSALEAQYLLRYDLDTTGGTIHGVGFYDLGVYPRLKANLSSTWSHPGGASAGASLRFVGSYQECAGNNCNDDRNLATAHEVSRYVKLDLFGGYDFGTRFGKTALQLGVNNVLDATPPVVYNSPAANSDPATYDFIGRTIYLRMSQRF